MSSNHQTERKMQNASSLNDLLAIIGSLTDEQLVDLPTFGGEEPESFHGVWSWDETRLLVSVNDSRRFAIVERDDDSARPS